MTDQHNEIMLVTHPRHGCLGRSHMFTHKVSEPFDKAPKEEAGEGNGETASLLRLQAWWANVILTCKST